MSTLRVVVELDADEASYLVESAKCGSIARFVAESVAGAVLDEFEASTGETYGTARVVVDGAAYSVTRT